MTEIFGVGPDQPTIENENGGKQSRLDYRCDLLPAAATLAVARVLHQGNLKYGPTNWRKIPCEDHLNHAMAHAFAYLGMDESDDHLAHFACRALMALEMHLGGKSVHSILEGLADRVIAQSELLSKKAEK